MLINTLEDSQLSSERYTYSNLYATMASEPLAKPSTRAILSIYLDGYPLTTLLRPRILQKRVHNGIPESRGNMCKFRSTAGLLVGNCPHWNEIFDGIAKHGP